MSKPSNADNRMEPISVEAIQEGNTGSIYSRIGGVDTIRRFVGDFYDRVEKDSRLKHMFVEETMDGPKDRLTLFLAMYFGGPYDYLFERGHPAIRLRHAPFAIGPLERDAWVCHMWDALDASGITDPVLADMKNSLARTATFLINRPTLADGSGTQLLSHVD